MTIFICAFSIGTTLPAHGIASASTSTDCPIAINEPADVINLAYDNKITFSPFSVDAQNTASIVVTNNTNCDLPLSLGSYKVFNQVVADQKLHDYANEVVGAHTARLLHVDLPSCMSQIDLLHDPNRDGPPTPPTAANPKLIGWTFQLHDHDNAKENDMFHFSAESPYNSLDRYPDDDDGYSHVPEHNRCVENPPLTVNCTVEPSDPTTNQQVQWKAINVSGGDGTYTYRWTGDVTGTDKTETATYRNPGEKSAQVTVESGEQRRSAECTVTVFENDGDDGTFDITHPKDSMWTTARTSLRSTDVRISVDQSNNFSQPVTLRAKSSLISNAETKFALHNRSPQKTLTLSPNQLDNQIRLFTNAYVSSGTYPIAITASSAAGTTASSTVLLHAQKYTEL